MGEQREKESLLDFALGRGIIAGIFDRLSFILVSEFAPRPHVPGGEDAIRRNWETAVSALDRMLGRGCPKG
jgi:hypothetical protein